MNERLTELEVKVAFLEHSVAQLDGVVRETRDAIDLIYREIRELAQSVSPSDRVNPDEEVPPHY